MFCDFYYVINNDNNQSVNAMLKHTNGLRLSYSFFI